jgi:small conductance mechanosensitive channel
MEIFTKILEFIKSSKFYGPILIIIVALILEKTIEKIIDNASIKGRTELEKKKRMTIVLLLKNISKYIIAIIAVVAILDVYGFDTTSLVAGLGVAGVVIGLALQDALKDIIGGINIIMDNYYVVGDLVEFEDFRGTVKEFGLKTTKIQSAKGEMLIVANRNIDKIINLSQKKAVIYLDIPTAYESDEKLVEKALNNALQKLKKDERVYSNDTTYLGINEFSASSINHLLQIKCNQGTQYAIRRLALKLVKEEYDKNGIKIPYDQIEVHHGSDI